MKKLLLLLTLFAAPAFGQHISTHQIKAGATDGVVLTTQGCPGACVSDWVALPSCVIATTSTAGCMMPDGTILLVDGAGHETIAKATNAAFGVMEGDTTTLSCTAGVCTVVGINGAGLPTSAGVVGTNASKQIVAASASDINNLVSGTRPWQATFTLLGVPANSQIMLLAPTTVAVTIPSGCAGSYMGATVSATAITDITINKLAGGPTGASTTLCTAAFAASPATTATFSGTGGSLAAGDYLEILGPATADATLANIGGAIYGTH